MLINRIYWIHIDFYLIFENVLCILCLLQRNAECKGEGCFEAHGRVMFLFQGIGWMGVVASISFHWVIPSVLFIRIFRNATGWVLGAETENKDVQHVGPSVPCAIPRDV